MTLLRLRNACPLSLSGRFQASVNHYSMGKHSHSSSIPDNSDCDVKCPSGNHRLPDALSGWC